jgi:hypothetical protein
MMKKCLFAAALLGLALAGGCAKGGNGESALIAVDTEITTPVNGNSNAIYPTQTLTLTATVTPAGTNPAVTWSLDGPGTLTPVTPATTPATATYVAPATAGTPATVTATSVANTQATGPIVLTIVDITTEVTPTAPNIGSGLTQQFTAVALPDDAPQTFTWTCTANGNPCANFSQDPNISGLAYYKATDNCSGGCIQISAITPLDTTGCATTPKYCTMGKPSLVTSRVNGTYAFQFSGYDGSGNVVEMAGTFLAANGTITTGTADERTSAGLVAHAITGGSYAPITPSDPNSNNAGTLTLTTGVFPNKFQVALDSAGDLSMIESDGHGTGSGIARLSAGSGQLKNDQTYAFGFTGVDSSGKRVGLAGLAPMDGSGTISGGQMDVNDNGNSTDLCSSPCSMIGTYTGAGQAVGTMVLISGSLTLHFDFFVSAGSGTSKTSPLTIYAISTDPVDATHPAVSGTMVLQDSSQTYNIAAFKGTSVSVLTGTGPNGANTNVSLTLGTTDGNGNFSGQFDQNNAGTILSIAQFPPSGSNGYTYAASSGTNGRYTFNLLGNPGASPAVAPFPFVLYASGANRGFLLDQSSASVMTGTMNPQGKGSGTFSGSELPGTFAAATTSSGDSAVSPLAANLLLTSPGNAAFNVSGTEYQNLGSAAVTGTYTMNVTGTGTIPLTVPSTQNYVIYAVDTAGCTGSNPVCTILDFFMIDVDKANADPAVIFAEQ